MDIYGFYIPTAHLPGVSFTINIVIVVTEVAHIPGPVKIHNIDINNVRRGGRDHAVCEPAYAAGCVFSKTDGACKGHRNSPSNRALTAPAGIRQKPKTPAARSTPHCRGQSRQSE